MAEKLSVLIIGAGNKGALGPVSHAEAFSENPAFKIVGFVDPDTEKAMEAMTRWGVGMGSVEVNTWFRDIKDNIDITVVATPDETQAEVLSQLIGKPVQFIFAEKPFTTSSKTASSLLKDFEANDQTVMVNYTRRFSPGFRDVRSSIKEWGGFLGGSAFYTKGLHNLCHWVDTFLMLGVNPYLVECIEIDRSKLNIFEAVLYFEGGRLDIYYFGEAIIFSPASQRSDYGIDRVIDGVDFKSYEGGLKNTMGIAVQNIADHLLSGTPLMQNAQDAGKVLEICERILK